MAAQYCSLVSPSSLDPRERANTIAQRALLVAILSAVFTGAAFLVPLGREFFTASYHTEQFLRGLTASSRMDVQQALTHVKQGSPAEDALFNLADLWRAAFEASGAKSEPDFKVEGATLDHTWQPYRVCFANIAVLPRKCWEVTDFIYEDGTGLVERFSVDGVPIDRISYRGSGDSDSLGNEGGITIDAYRRGWLGTPANDRACVAFLLKAPDVGKIVTHHFSREDWQFVDRQQKTVKGDIAWPAKVHNFRDVVAAVCVDSSAGLVLINEVKTGKDHKGTSSGWLWL